MGFNAVADRVLHQRLQNKIRNPGVERLRRDIHLHHQPVSKTDLLNFQVPFEKFQFFAQSHLLRVGFVQRGPQQIAQAHDHPVGGFHVLVHQRGNGMQTVEKKMRIQLHLQCL